ncbi:MAG: hypothetical protein HZY77_04945 [Thiobacillus sp.]|uniref:hypothetical protein n=1 Tax=Thiobacillus sp. TaxID=924 RepID=UPI00168C348D|nr:hypothetical protein [Thiobacillus sp.]QLQ02290.1 MAG: hypothetical protein HZY77_04945 [Thiobacillus sp.]
MPRWDVALTRQLIEQRYGREQLYRARHCLRAVHERQRHARYHFQEAKRLLKTHIDDRLETESIHALTLFPEAKERATLDECLMMVEANMIACAQGIHSIPDSLAHVVYFALGQNLGPKPLKECDVSVRSIVTVLAASTPKHIEIEHILRGVADQPSFAALNAIVNHGKHRGIVEPCLAIEPVGRDTPYAMEFGAITYGGRNYPEREIEEVIAPAYEVASHAVVDIGNAINRALSIDS